MGRPTKAEVRLAQYRIFNKLCITYLRRKDDAFLRAHDVRKELGISNHVFTEALKLFQDGDRLAVEPVEIDGEIYLRLGALSRYICD
jgi:hypothetical protein